MTTDVILSVALVVVCLLLLFIYLQPTKSSFDITVDPLRTGYKQTIYDCPTSLPAQGNGLNTQNGGSDFTVCKFVKKLGDSLSYPVTDPFDAVPRQYCALMYENFHDDFSEKWESLGICEKDVKEQLKSCPEMKKHIKTA